MRKSVNGKPSEKGKDSKPRRQQFTSCDMCRKGKRACDGRWKMENKDTEKDIACTLCERKGLNCTFNMSPYADGINYIRQARKARHSQPFSLSGGQDQVDSIHTSSSLPEILIPQQNVFSHQIEFPLSIPAENVASGSNLRLDDNIQGSIQHQFGMDANALSYLHQSIESNHSTFNTQDAVNSSFMHGRSSTHNSGTSTSLPTRLDSRESSLNIESDRYYLRQYANGITSVTLGLSLACWIASDNNPLLSSSAFSGMRFSSSNTNSNSVFTWLTIDKVHSLDKHAHPLLGISCSSDVDEIATQKAVDLSLLAFATQWQPKSISESPLVNNTSPSHHVNDAGRASLWLETLQHLLNHSHLNSFRFILASILFAWTEPPKSLFYDQSFTGGISSAPRMEKGNELGRNISLDRYNWQRVGENGQGESILVTSIKKLHTISTAISRLRKRRIPPWQTVFGNQNDDSSELPFGNNQLNVTPPQLSPAFPFVHPTTNIPERDIKAEVEYSNTYILFYWLAIVVDTETSVLRKRPPVIEDAWTMTRSDLEDGSLLLQVKIDHDTVLAERMIVWQECDNLLGNESLQRHMDNYSFESEQSSIFLLRICRKSTPIKMLLFRSVSRLQIAYWRNESTKILAKHLQSAFSCTKHWQKHYASAYTIMRQRHPTLTIVMQSAYILVGIPYNLAVLLLTDFVHVIYADRAATKTAALNSNSGNSIEEDNLIDSLVDPQYITHLRRRACTDIAEMMWAIQRSSSISENEIEEDQHEQHQKSSKYHLNGFFKRNGTQSAILTAPWAEIIVHGLCAAMECDRQLINEASYSFDQQTIQEAQKRLGAFQWGLSALSDRSLLASLAAEEVLVG